MTRTTRRARDAAVERLEHEHHIDREALVIQLRALAGAVEQLADAVSATAGDDAAVRNHLAEARLALREIW